MPRDSALYRGRKRAREPQQEDGSDDGEQVDAETQRALERMRRVEAELEEEEEDEFSDEDEDDEEEEEEEEEDDSTRRALARMRRVEADLESEEEEEEEAEYDDDEEEDEDGEDDEDEGEEEESEDDDTPQQLWSQRGSAIDELPLGVRQQMVQDGREEGKRRLPAQSRRHLSKGFVREGKGKHRPSERSSKVPVPKLRQVQKTLSLTIARHE